MELSNWQLCYEGQWYPASVPSFVHTDLMANGLIADPYFGTNEDSVQWVSDSTWHYRTSICRDSLPHGDSFWLVFEGLAGPATITYGFFEPMEAEHDNMFTQLVLPVRQEWLGDKFIVDVVFAPLCDSAREAAYGIPLPERRAFTRVAPYQQGWDWGPRLATCGIWKRAYITSVRPEGAHQTETSPSGLAVELRQEPDSIGQCFTFYRDGKPLFMKGANWIPVHSFPVLTSEQKARYRYLLTSAKEAGFNMLRVWGGGIYEHDYFYDLCDSLGLMVWQDFMFAGTPYPDNDEMLANIEEEAYQNVKRLARHPCIVVWCGNNEVRNGWEDWGWQQFYHWTPEQRARLEHAIDTIFGIENPTASSSQPSSANSQFSILERAVRDCDPLGRPYIATSPLYGWGHPECTTHGDSHYWGVWWGDEPFEAYRAKTGRFMSEFGFQSYPLWPTLRRMGHEEELELGSPTLRNHQKHPRGIELIDNAMRRYYGFDSRSLPLADYAYVSQLLQAWGVGYGIVCHLSDPRCSGSLFWQLNDCWPVASWSSIDFFGNWKALQHRVAELFADNADLAHWQRYYSVYPKNRHYPEPRYSMTQAWQSDGALVVTLRAESDLYDLCFDTEPHVDGHFSLNFCNLEAGQTVAARFVPVDPKADVSGLKVVVRTLNEIYLRAKKK